ncbi:MAG: adenylyltransferase [Acidobacteria bacterium]|nr:MAG: adenylyltransferase [Acidobacteriota bacterium]
MQKLDTLISPCGDTLVDLVAAADEVADLKVYAESLPSLSLSERCVYDLELLATGAFSPLDRFMGRADYEGVVEEMRLTSGHIFPIPVTLPIGNEITIRENSDVALRDAKRNVLAVMHVDEIYEWVRDEYTREVLQTESLRHPLVTEIRGWGDRFISGPMRVFQIPPHFDFPELRRTPRETREALARFGNKNVVAFQTRNPLHRAHEEMTKLAIERTDGVLLMHPVVGMTKPGDVNHYSRIRTYKTLTEKHYDPDRVLLSLLPLAMRLAGPREALWHALIRRNYGANHFIVGRDHASPGVDENGRPFYGPYEAIELVRRFSDELGVRVMSFEELVYLPDDKRYEEISKVEEGKTFFALSGAKIRNDYLSRARRPPEWLMRREIADVLLESYPPRERRGVCIWFTGLSGSGKSTIAEILSVLLSSHGRRVSLLDGDIVRTHLSAGLGFDKADRDTNIRRIGFVASEIVKHGGVAICAAISPYHQTRDEVREMIGDSFFELFVSTPLEVCEQRDPKGLYAKARKGDIENFTGIDDVYEPPSSPAITIDTINFSAEENARSILAFLHEHGFVRI